MQQRIFKYLLDQGEQVINMPCGSTILSVDEQNDEIVLYAMVNPDVNPVSAGRRILVVGTGWEFSLNVEKFIGTVKLEYGALMFHVFDGGEI